MVKFKHVLFQHVVGDHMNIQTIDHGQLDGLTLDRLWAVR